MGEFDSMVASYNWTPSGGAAAATPSTGFQGGGPNIGVFGSVVSGLTNAYVAYAQGEMAADTMTFNAKLKDIQAKMMSHTAKLNADKIRDRGRRFVKGQQARYSKAGVKLEGSPIDVMIDTAANFELDAKITEINADMGVASKEMEGASMRSQGDYYREAGIRRAGSTLLTTTMDAVGTYYNPKG